MTYEEIVKNNIIEKYLRFELSEEEKIAFEEHLLFNEKTRKELEKAEKLFAGLRLVAKEETEGKKNNDAKIIRLKWFASIAAAACIASIFINFLQFNSSDSSNVKGISHLDTTIVNAKSIADSLFSVALETEPDSQIESYKTILTIYDALILRKPLCNDCFSKKGEIHLILNEIKDAELSYLKALEISKNTKYYHMLVKIYSVQSDIDKSLQYLNLAIEKGDFDIEVLNYDSAFIPLLKSKEYETFKTENQQYELP